MANRRAQSHEQVLGGRLAATTSFTVNRMGKQQEEKITGMGEVKVSFPMFICRLTVRFTSCYAISLPQHLPS